MLKSKRLKAGIVGYGYMGRIRHKNVLDNPNIDLIAICDPFLGDDALVHSAGIDRPASWEELLECDLDAVFVCTPNNMIPKIAVASLDLGKHVFCEKPPGRSLSDIQLIHAAEKRNPEAKLIFGFNHRHHPGIMDAKAVIDSGILGQILTMRGVYGKGAPYDYHKSWRNDPLVGGGGILLDQGIHMLDLFRYFVGDFEHVLGMRGTTAFDIEVEDNAFVLLRTKLGQVAQLHSSATSWKHMFRLEIGCEKGYVTISGLLSKTGSYGRETLVVGRRPALGERGAIGNPREETTYYDSDPSWDLEVSHFTDCILGGQQVEKGTSADALRVMEIIDEIYKQPLVKKV
jgi:predicted dehydrogenase